jgi:hypothetical protein
MPCEFVRCATVAFVCAATIKGNANTAVTTKASFIHLSTFFCESHTKLFEKFATGRAANIIDQSNSALHVTWVMAVLARLF